MSINLLKYSVKQLPKGFTLVELLMVILLMGVMAMTTLAVVTDEDDQQRYDATKTYLQLIKKAIVGDPSRTLNGETEVSGFVADMGRLPECLRELVQAVNCDADITDGIDVATEALPLWQQDEESLVWSGWRGPYLQGLPESSGLTFRDGWKNLGPTDATANADINYGWLFGTVTTGTTCADAVVAQPVDTEIIIQSCGGDGVVGVSNELYASDYPAAANAVLINAFDHQVVLGSEWDSVDVAIVNETGTPLAKVNANTLRLQVNYTQDGEMPEYPAAPDDEGYLSQSFPAYNWTIATGIFESVSGAVTVPAGSTLSVTTLSIVVEGRMVFPDGTAVNLVGCSTLSPCAITVPSGSELSGTTLTIATAGSITIPPQHNAGLSVLMHDDIADLALPIGQPSMTIVCNADGVLFDGNCDGDSEDATSKPYSFSVKPRKNVTPPNLISWVIQ